MSALSLETKPIPMRKEARRRFMESRGLSPSPPPSNATMETSTVSYSKRSTRESKEYYKSDTLEKSRQVRTTEEEVMERGSPKFFHQRLLERSSSDVDVVDSAPTSFNNYSSSPTVNSDRYSAMKTGSRLLGSNPSLIINEQHQQKARELDRKNYFNSTGSNSSSPTPGGKGQSPVDKIEYNIRIEKSPDILLNRGPSPVTSVKGRRFRDDDDSGVEVVELQLNKEIGELEAPVTETRKYPALEPQLLVQSEFNKGNKTSYDFVPIVESKKEKKRAKKEKERREKEEKKSSSFSDAFFDAFVFMSDCLTCNGRPD